jgi:hypothetical protein
MFTETTAALGPIESTTTDGDVDDARWQAADDLLGRIASILDAARGQVVRAVNHATVSAYWHIGREIVDALQKGEEPTAFGRALIERLA